MLPAVHHNCSDVARQLESSFARSTNFPIVVWDGESTRNFRQQQLSVAALQLLGRYICALARCLRHCDVSPDFGPRRVRWRVASDGNTKRVNTAMSLIRKLLELDSLFNSHVSVYHFPRIYRLMAATFGAQLCMVPKEEHLRRADRKYPEADTYCLVTRS
jgi:hypothetical protein